MPRLDEARATASSAEASTSPRRVPRSSASSAPRPHAIEAEKETWNGEYSADHAGPMSISGTTSISATSGATSRLTSSSVSAPQSRLTATSTSVNGR